MSFNPAAIRSEFPILARSVHGRPLAYLDNAASAQKPSAVMAAMQRMSENAYANVHRGVHTLANEATQAYEDARHAVQRLLNARYAEEIVFTKGATHAINIVANGIADEIKPGDEIIVSVIEHHANIVPWHFLRERYGAVLKWLEIDDAGRLCIDELEGLISSRTKMVALSHMSNVFGLAIDGRRIVEIAHAHGVPVLLDGCQAVVHQRVDVQALDCDYYTFSGHKLYGPTGIGALYGKKDALARLRPFEGGGEMIDIVSQERITYNEPPHRFEAGTPPILEAVGLGAAIAWLERLDRDAIAAHENALKAYTVGRLRDFNAVRVHGDAAAPGGIIAFSVDGAHPHDVAQILDRYGVAVRAGHHCAQPLMARLGVNATARASFALYNTFDEADQLIEALVKAQKMLG